ncbi:MAG: VWA domain-containing protein [Planctomycetes bacterium]|nr:VWA domain-containing protein [Planctomycetota bacterium]
MARRALAVTIAALALFSAWQPAAAQKQAKPAADAERKKMLADFLKKLPESKSLHWNATQLEAFSRMPGDDVIPTLLGIYNAPPAFADNMRYLTAAYIRARHDVPAAPKGYENLIPRMAPSAAEIATLQKWLATEARREPGLWSAYCAAAVLALEQNADIDLKLLGIVGDTKAPAVVRAAVLEALSLGACETLRPALQILLAAKFKNTGSDAALQEAAFWAAARAYRPLHQPGRKISDQWLPVFEAVCARMEDEKNLPARSLRQAALALQFCFGTRQPYQFPQMWRQLLATGVDPLDKDDGQTAASFMGLDVTGDRIVLIIDASDSMLNPLNEADLTGLRGPVTGERASRKNKDEYEIDWRRVRNRFDAAREHAKWTLSRLPKDKQVAVLLFGDDVKPLDATTSFVAATPGAVRGIMAALDAIAPREPIHAMKARRPYGVLMGETNYYRALLAAFRMGKGGIVNEPREHFDGKLILEGADAIILLSDGAPIRDGFSGQTPDIKYEYDSYTLHSSKQPGEGYWVETPARPAIPEQEYTTRDPETGIVTKHKMPAQPAQPATRAWAKKERTSHTYKDMHENGPYATDGNAGSAGFGGMPGFELANLLAEVERMNLVRRAQIQCIGIGEARMEWLRPIAARTGGRAVFIGKEGTTEAGPSQPGDGGFPDGFPQDD